MPKKMVKGFVVGLLAFFVTGCGSTLQVPKVGVKGYLKDEKRVDQELHGNGGYLLGESKEDIQRKPTRKIFVVEFTQESSDVSEKRIMLEAEEYVEQSEKDSMKYQAPASNQIQESKAMSYSTPDVSIPSFNFDELQVEDEIPSPGDGKTVEYTIEKDDTLQKISKKFYNSYSKWPQIYQANKSTIRNPDVLSPGTVIRIPVE